MKNLPKLIFVIAFLTFSSCELTDMDLVKDPNGLEYGDADPTLLLNAVQKDFGTTIDDLQRNVSETVRIINMDGRIYKDAYEPGRFNRSWERTYQEMFQDIRLMTPLAEEFNYFHHIGMGQVIEAYMIMTLVDLFGDIPYTEALKGEEERNLDPKLDPGASVYAAAVTLLDNAIVNFGKKVEKEPIDLFYAGDWSKWIKAANSIKLRIYVNTRAVDNDAITKFNAIITANNFIVDESEDFQFRWGTSNSNPDTRHPLYNDNYTTSGSNAYQSNWFMNYMYADKTNNGNETFEGPDPRMKYYFYRQTDKISENPNQINCIAETAPAHYINTIFCSLPEGYWGRDHGDDDGIPPDGQLRTTYGIYPAGGRFDDNTYKAIGSIALGAGGAGITPLMLSSWVNIMRAEMVMTGGTGDAAVLLQDGVRQSFQKVREFGLRDLNADLSKAPDAALDEAYIDELGQLFNAASEGAKWDILGSEYFVTLFGNGLDAFNFYRRTGRPSTLQPNLERSPGDFFRSFLYPSSMTERNASVKQKNGVTDRVFWDQTADLLSN